ncbi:MAG: hypothetical protein JWP17_1069 [Solirubrobacterales bacterium]|nr:hypothetical protein [Solirubrobacterales bacterium]
MSTTQPSHQTVRLSRGKHSSPSQGVCVMELASMLAGEPFTDRPACADPVLGGLLRAYNDTIDGERRQDLYQVAALVVGTASTPEVQRMRANRCLVFATAHRRRSRWRRRHGTPALAAHLGQDAPGVLAVRALGRVDDVRHRELLALVHELVWMGQPRAEHPADIAAERVGAAQPRPLSSARA